MSLKGLKTEHWTPRGMVTVYVDPEVVARARHDAILTNELRWAIQGYVGAIRNGKAPMPPKSEPPYECEE